jgi:hypothetical protein
MSQQSLQNSRNRFLIFGAVFSALAAFVHLGCIVFGASWYRFLGAGEGIAHMAEMGHWYPSMLALLIAALLFVWSAYALSGAGVIGRLPLRKLGLCVITAIYVGRGIGFVAIMPMFPGNSFTFWIISSGICLMFGLLHLAGLRQVWKRL